MIDDLKARSAYLLSVHEDVARNYFSCHNQSDLFKKIGELLGIIPTTVKQTRELFDPYTDSSRVGWHSRVREDIKNLAEKYKSDFDPEAVCREIANYQVGSIPNIYHVYQNIPKPFLLLAGISGTGKTRFVREQAKASAVQYSMAEGENHCLVPVRPDWHEPSDLLGYISRIGSGGTRYVTTDLLRFIVAAWKHAAESVSATHITRKPLDTICPFWLCLDEMNLAPVEQYFADYLSILETRKWDGEAYSCDPLLKPAVIQQQLEEAGRKDLWDNLGIAGDDPLSAGLRDYFAANGIPLPPNLIVAGTVNMDETTHGFSRKVIDRALTIDFGEFFPNDYDQYYDDDKKTAVKPLSFPRLSKINNAVDLAAVAADPDALYNRISDCRKRGAFGDSFCARLPRPERSPAVGGLLQPCRSGPSAGGVGRLPDDESTAAHRGRCGKIGQSGRCQPADTPL